MTTVSSDRILENIYGITATGTIKNNMTGGNIRNHYVGLYQSNHRDRATLINNMNNIKYVDDKQINALSIAGGKRKMSSRGKNTKRSAVSKQGGKDIIIYASPEYIKDADLQTFIDKFFLYYRVSRSPNSAIYIIPPSATLKDMVAKRGNGEEGSIELQKEVRQNKDIQWERYCLITFGNNSSNDKYRIDPALTDPAAYPNSSFDEIRRTNLLGEVFYISYKDKDSVYINSKPRQNSGMTLKFVARFNKGGYVFKGELPKDVVEHIGPKDSAKRLSKHRRQRFNNLSFGELPFVGGNANTSFDVLQCYDDVYNHDHELAAEHFMRCFAKKAKGSANDIRASDDKYFGNSDMIFNALYYAASNPSGVNMSDFGEEITDDEFKELFAKFSPVSKSNIGKINTLTKKISKLYNNVVRDKNEPIQYINAVKNIYKNISDKLIPTVDIMTGYVRNNEIVNFNQVYKDIYDTMNTDTNTTCQDCAMINNAITSNTLPSLVGRCVYPVFCSMCGGSFESNVKTLDAIPTISNAKDEDEDNKNIVGDIFNKCPCDEGATEQPTFDEKMEEHDDEFAKQSVSSDDDINSDLSDDGIDKFFDE